MTFTHHTQKLKRNLLALLCLCCSFPLFAQNGTWTWMHGSNLANAPASFGTIGVPSPTNDPPPMYETTELVDLNGKFWIFGGLDNNTQEQSALWKFDPGTNMWTWMKGPSTPAVAGSYGTQGVPSPGNYPGGRAWGVMSWTDATGNLWIFGGYGYDAFGVVGALADLWKYDISTNMWTWMSGPNTSGYAGNYGTMQVPAATNQPPGRYEAAAAWTSNNGDLWMYGGGSFSGNFNDMWRYSPATNTWTWMAGSNLPNAAANFGTQFIPAATNTPGARFVYGRWKDLSGNLWLFGGMDNLGSCWADMWEYDITNNVWIWIAGSNVPNDPGTFTQKCTAGNGYPGARYENRCAWMDDCGRFWQYGGFAGGIGTLNDLWMFDPNTTQFTWVGGSTAQNVAGNYGTQLVPAPTNYPDGGAGGTAFRDLQGNFWMFGAWAAGGRLNALWEYTLDPNCPAATQPQVAINYTPPACAPQTIFFNASTNNVGYTYSWDFGDTATLGDTANTAASSYNYNSPGTYTVTLIVSGNIGCAIGSDTATAVIVIGGAGALNIGNDTAICGAVNLTLSAPSANSYLWSTGAVTQNITVNAIGTYWVTVNSATCPATDTLIVTSATGPNIGPDTSFCQGGSITYNGGIANSWIWSNGDTTQTISPTTSGTYYVNVTIGSCTFSDTAVLTIIPSPVVSLGNDTTICGPISLVLDAGNPGANYLWSTGAVTQTINVNAPGTYYVTASNSTCSNVDTMVVTGFSPPAVGNDTTICQGQPLTLNGGPATSWLWSTGAVTQTITPSTSGTYWVDATTNGCTQRDSIQVTINALPQVNLGSDTMICPGSLYTLDAGNPGANYTWSTGESTQTISVDSAGTYYVVVSSNNCPSGDSVVITTLPEVNMGNEISLCGTFNLVLDPHINGASYLWSTGATTQTINVGAAGEYSVVVNNGTCILRDTVTVTGSLGEGTVYIPNTFTPNGNTVNEKFSAVGEGIEAFHMKIFNRWGELIYETSDINDGWDGRFKGKTVQVDTYVYVIEYRTECAEGKMKREIGHVNVVK